MPAVDERTDAKWHAAVEEHRIALAAYLDAAGRLDDSAWVRPWAPGKWTPAEITAHLVLGYELLAGRAEGGAPVRAGARWREALGRWVVLPHILFHRSFPFRLRSPREMHPRPPCAPRLEALDALLGLGERLEDAVARTRRSGGRGFALPHFGPVGATQLLRFVAVHLEHHRRQLVARA